MIKMPIIEDLPDVPPALLLLLKEIATCNSWTKMRLRIKGMLRELRDQSEAFAIHQINRVSDRGSVARFEIHLHGAMDLLSGQGCADLKCRVEAAKRTARSVGLIADRVWLTDLLSEQFVDFGKPTKEKIDAVIADVVVLSQLLPLIAAGVVRFRSPWIPACRSCSDYFYSRAEEATEELTNVFLSEIRIADGPDGMFYAHTGNCLEPTLVYHNIPKNRENVQEVPTAREWAKSWIHNEFVSILWRAREASMTGGSVFSNSRVGLSGLLLQEGRLNSVSNLSLLDSERNISVPWVSDLDAQQIVQLRNEASLALPQFREKISQALSPRQSDAPTTTATSLLTELRAQAAEVRSELEIKRKSSARYWKATYGILGLGLSAYGIGTDQVLAGIGGLLPVIHLLINHKTGQESEVAKLTTKPGYVLVKAQDILAHAHEKDNAI